MTFLADLSRELVCRVPAGEVVRFDPTKATLIWSTVRHWDNGSIGGVNEEYHFITPEKTYVELTFARKGSFRKSLEEPYIAMYGEGRMCARLSIAKCPIEIIEKYCGRQEVT